MSDATTDDTTTDSATDDSTDTEAEPPDDPRVARTRSAVHEAGRGLLVESGPAAITHAAIASAARVSRTTLYKYWPTRADLLIDICDGVEPQVRIPPSGDVRSDLLRLTTNVADTLADPDLRKLFASMLVQTQWEDEARQAQLALTDRGLADLTALLDAGVESGDLPPGLDPTRAAGRLLGPVFFSALVSGADFDAADVERVVDDWLATVRR